MRRRSLPLAAFVATLAIGLVALLTPAHAMKIQQVKSPGGIEAWLVEEHSVPIIALHFSFKGGASQDPADKPGVAYMLTSILDEGAGDMSAAQFHERMEELAVKMRFDAGRDNFTASFETLSMNRDQAFELLRLALTKPRFDKDAVERMQSQLLANLAFSERDPDRVAAREWFKIAFAGHPYARPVEGTKESLPKIGKEDLEGYRRRVFARDTLKVSVVGDIDAKTLGALLDRVFGELPAKSGVAAVPAPAAPFGPRQQVIEMNVPQSVATFGHGAILRKDPDFIPAFIINYVLGGGGFNSRLMEQVREKRGLAYSVHSYLSTYDHVGLYLGGVATKNEAILQSIDVIREELKRMADEGPTEVELANAKSYLTGSYPLRFDTSPKIASQLLGIQMEELGIDYIDKRNGLIEVVTIDDVRRVAKRILKSDAMIITIVGKPTGKGAEEGGNGNAVPARAKGSGGKG
jgi:zinc protease